MWQISLKLLLRVDVDTTAPGGFLRDLPSLYISCYSILTRAVTKTDIESHYIVRQDGESVHRLSSTINEQMVKELAKWWQERYDKLSTEVAAEPCEWAEELRLMRTHSADTAIHQPAIDSGEEIELEAMKSVD